MRPKNKNWKKNEIMPLAVTKMDLEIIRLSEVSQRQISDGISHMWNLIFKMAQMNMFIKQKQTYWKQTYGFQRGHVERRGRINQELGMNVYTVLYTRQISSKDLQYSKGNSTQYSVIIYVRKESEKEWVHIQTNHASVYLKLTQCCKSIRLQ